MKSDDTATTSTVIDGDRICLSVAETAQRLGLCQPTIWAEIARGRLRVARVGRRVLVQMSSIRAWLAAAMKT